MGKPSLLIISALGATIGIISAVVSLIVLAFYFLSIAVVTFIQINQLPIVQAFLSILFYASFLMLIIFGIICINQLAHSKINKRLFSALTSTLVLYLLILFCLSLIMSFSRSLFILTLSASILSILGVLLGFLITFLNGNRSFSYSKTSVYFHNIVIYYITVNISFAIYLNTKLGFFFGLGALFILMMHFYLKIKTDLVDVAFKYWLAISIILSTLIWIWLITKPTSQPQFNFAYFIFVFFLLLVASLSLRRLFFQIDLVQVGLVFIWANIGPLIIYPSILSSLTVSPGPIMIVLFPLLGILFALLLINIPMLKRPSKEGDSQQC